MHLGTTARSLAAAVGEEMDAGRADEYQTMVRRAVDSDPLYTRITFISADGTVLSDSYADRTTLGSHADRPEFLGAMREGHSSVERWSHTQSRTMHYAAIRLGEAKHPHGVIRVGIPASSVVSWGAGSARLALMIALAGLAMAVLLALGLALMWSRRIGAITEASLRMLRGLEDASLAVRGQDEVAMLARSLNTMRRRLRAQLAVIERQNAGLKEMLGHLREGVVVVGADGKIRLVNAEAARLLGMTSPRRNGTFEGLPYEQCIPQHDVQELLSTSPVSPVSGATGTREADDPAPATERQIQFAGPGGTVSLRARVFHLPLPAAEAGEADRGHAEEPGRLLVFTDITELSEMVQMKSDFAANASHELRTPLSAIRAAVETLRALDGVTAEPQAARFFEMIERQLARMEAMVLDLLDLSRVESPGARFHPDALRLRPLLDDLRETFEEELSEKSLRWEVDITGECETLWVSAQLLQITLRNLIENSIRFTAPGGFVRISARREKDVARLEVADNGCGIPPEDQSRVFERFYQVERARSGQKRGTGLGLSIVRHAVSAMRGEVSLSSAPGRGTTVAIEIPCVPGKAWLAGDERPRELT